MGIIAIVGPPSGNFIASTQTKNPAQRKGKSKVLPGRRLTEEERRLERIEYPVTFPVPRKRHPHTRMPPAVPPSPACNCSQIFDGVRNLLNDGMINSDAWNSMPELATELGTGGEDNFVRDLFRANFLTCHVKVCIRVELLLF